MTDFVLQRDHTHRSLSGHIINFIKGVPVYVPPVCHKEVAAIGALPDDGSIVDPLDDDKKQKPELTADERREKLMEAFVTLEERQNREDFTGQGLPAVAVVKKMVEFDVTKAEIEALWRELHDVTQD